MAFDTALNIVADAAVELGLYSYASKPTVAFANTDANVGLLVQLLKSVGRNLMREAQWSALTKSYAFTTTTNVGRYSLPADFDRVIDQTVWNRTNRLPVGGPISQQTFQALKAQLAGTVANVLFQLLQGQFQAFPDLTTPGSYAIAYGYMSRFWVSPAATEAAYGTSATPGLQPFTWQNASAYLTNALVTSAGQILKCTTPGTSGSANPAVTSGTVVDGTVTWTWQAAAGTDAPAADGDVIRFDPQLVLAALKLAWREEKGMDSAKYRADYNEALEAAISADIAAPALTFTGSESFLSEPLLSTGNLPKWGS